MKNKSKRFKEMLNRPANKFGLGILVGCLAFAVPQEMIPENVRIVIIIALLFIIAIIIYKILCIYNMQRKIKKAEKIKQNPDDWRNLI